MTHALPAVSQFVCGQPVTRVDGQPKVTGKAPYAADNQIPGLVHATLGAQHGGTRSRQPYRHTGAALRHRDVLRVLTDFAGVKLPFDIRQVSYFGRPLAVVIATTLEAAAHGASLVDVRYSSRTMLTDVEHRRPLRNPGILIATTSAASKGEEGHGDWRAGPWPATATPLNVSYRVDRISKYLSGHWLDFGCADGGYDEEMLARGLEAVSGVDVEESRIADAKRRNLPNAQYTTFDGRTLPFGDGTFDGAFMNEVFEHVADERRALVEIFRVLKPGGVLVRSAPTGGFQLRVTSSSSGRRRSAPRL